MAIYEDPYFVTADPYGALEGEEQEEEVGDVTEELQEVEEFAYVQPDDTEEVTEVAEGDAYAYAEGEEEEPFEEEAFELPNVEDDQYQAQESADQQVADGEVVYLDEAEDAEAAQVESQWAEAQGETEAFEGYEEEQPEEEALLDFPAEAEVEPCSPGLEVHEEEGEEGLGFHTALEEVDYTPQEEDEDEGGESDEEPSWLRNVGVLDAKVAEDADVSAAFLDGLTGSEMDLDLAFPQYVPCLARYLVGHPEALVTKKKKGHKKGSGKRYFGGEDRSEDVMADKVVTGCWACGKLDHESQNCSFKRCFVCSEQGHEVSECRKRSISCKRCFRQGHFSDLCPLEEYETFDREDDMSFCRCMKCGEEGHLNCGTVPEMEFLEANPHWQDHGEQYFGEEQPRNDWSSHREVVWGNGGWDGWQKDAMAGAWMFQAGMSPGPMDWAPPAGDGGGYGYGGGGNRWHRTGNNKGWGGGNRWNGGWGRQDSWDQGWSGWDGPPQKRRRH